MKKLIWDIDVNQITIRWCRKIFIYVIQFKKDYKNYWF